LEFGEEDDDDDDEEPVDDDDDEEGAEDKDIGVGKEKRMMLFSLAESSKALEKKVFESHSIKSPQETYRRLSFSFVILLMRLKRTTS
jgi:hypothetical protein